MGQALAVFHHATLGLLRIEGDFLDRKVLVLLLRFSLQSQPSVTPKNHVGRLSSL